jgi:troponin I
LLRKKAAEELKREHERKAEERRKIIRQRTGEPKNLDGANEGNAFKLFFFVSVVNKCLISQLALKFNFFVRIEY